VPVVNPGDYRHWVDLDDPVPDGSPVTFSPARIKAAIKPVSPGAFDEQKVTDIVEVRYHPQITFNTRLIHRGRSLYVRGIQNHDERGRYMTLLCEEVVTP
jgi:head-tail adaptor